MKNKLAPPFGTAEYQMLFGKGINRAEEMLAQGLKYGLIRTTGVKYFAKVTDEAGVEREVDLGLGRAKAVKGIEAWTADDFARMRARLLALRKAGIAASAAPPPGSGEDDDAEYDEDEDAAVGEQKATA